MLHVAERARDDFGRLLATGVAAMLGFQAIVNVGANLTLLPVRSAVVLIFASAATVLPPILMGLPAANEGAGKLLASCRPDNAPTPVRSWRRDKEAEIFDLRTLMMRLPGDYVGYC